MSRVNKKSGKSLMELLLDANDAYHEGLDILFARMMLADKEFFPSQSGRPWEAITAGRRLAERARAVLRAEEAPTEYPAQLWDAGCVHALGIVMDGLTNDAQAERYMDIRNAFLSGAMYAKREAALDELVKTSEAIGLYNEKGTTNVNK